jgi:hypothetical protein
MEPTFYKPERGQENFLSINCIEVGKSTKMLPNQKYLKGLQLVQREALSTFLSSLSSTGHLHRVDQQNDVVLTKKLRGRHKK